VTDEQLHAIMPAVSAPRRAELRPFLQAAMAEFAIKGPAREAAFVAQLAHESGQLRFMEEIWGPTEAQRRYEPPGTLAERLGNTEPGDGRRFKGRGPIQITGRANYQRFGGLLGVDLVSHPERAVIPDLAFRIAGLFWKKKGLNELADRASADAFREITRRINGGLNGLKDRERFYNAARAVLGVSDVPVRRGAGRGLPTLGRAQGRPDSSAGSGSARAESRGEHRRGASPGASEEQAFERGYEAIRAFTRRRRVRKFRKTGRRRGGATRSAAPPTSRRKKPRRTKRRSR
jgi:putative chitinase